MVAFEENLEYLLCPHVVPLTVCDDLAGDPYQVPPRCQVTFPDFHPPELRSTQTSVLYKLPGLRYWP